MKSKSLVTIALLSISFSALSSVDVIYGTDNRQDVYQVTNPLHQKLVKSTAGMINKGYFIKGATAGTFDLKGTNTLERAHNICASEKFSQQQVAPTCSGFLVGPDTIVTAGHCYNSFDLPENVCSKFMWVFDYDMKSAGHNPTKGLKISNIYGCKKVLAVKRDNFYDFAVIRLDRKVVGREPLKFRTTGKVPSNTPLMVIGHPTGLPTKVSADGKITKNSEYTRFSTTLDTFHGNSGSAVFNSSTGQVEGVLIMGKNDYAPSNPLNPKSCLTTNKCDENAMNCSAGADQGVIANGEVVLRIEIISQVIKNALLQ